MKFKLRFICSHPGVLKSRKKLNRSTSFVPELTIATQSLAFILTLLCACCVYDLINSCADLKILCISLKCHFELTFKYCGVMRSALVRVWKNVKKPGSVEWTLQRAKMS